ncbi:MAG: hypothetical protein HKN10_19020, partial [Myxococcales bacterium]|nr:hypothetical protein [Myxococcales bacterium]
LARGLLWLFQKRASLGKTVALAASVIVLGFAVVTSLHSRVFASSSSLWEYEVTRNPDNPFALHAVGTARTRAGLRDSGLDYLREAQLVAARTCVRDDRLRAVKDLGWALALRTSPDDQTTLLALQSAYARVTRDGAFAYRGHPPWQMQLTPRETSDFVAEDLQYALPRATVEARLGNINAAMQILQAQAIEADSLHPLSKNLRFRLGAAQGRIEESLRELGQDASVSDAGRLRSVLATLRETLLRTNLPSDAKTRLAGYALGFGQAPNDLAGLPREIQTALDALRAYETDAPVDLAALEQQSAGSRELPRFIELAKAKEGVRRFDDQLRSAREKLQKDGGH